MSYTILALATWRLASLFANEDGPFDIFVRIRHFVGVKYDAHSIAYGENVISKGIICVWCNSIWFGFALAILNHFFHPYTEWFCIPFALSTIAILIEKAVNRG